jgi:apolipoprotein N-acyltransferase
VVQVSPTGFSAFVSAGGDVFDRSGVSEQKVVTRTVPLYSGRTWYSHLGDIPFLLLIAAAFGISWIVPGRAALERRRLTPPTAV